MAANDIILVFLIRPTGQIAEEEDDNGEGAVGPFRQRQRNHITINMKFQTRPLPISRLI